MLSEESGQLYSRTNSKVLKEPLSLINKKKATEIVDNITYNLKGLHLNNLVATG